ncbi:hypothetical protein F444_14740 [Phytophthora nicotianae P1976]|uniref:Uncharacterized protein n=1 Tax=Phytophthora nicotianae P1976 TaxID=1317066 RepID=A0A080ZP47_PHYNI|nr:hypothetical protein F444_14740 [Phytophthora nicotianae P1976]
MGAAQWKKLWDDVKDALTEYDRKVTQTLLAEAKAERKALMDRLDTLSAQLADATGNNAESLKAFQARIAREQHTKIITIIDNQLTNALDQYDGISLRYDPLAVQRQFDSEDVRS